jgi:hypothetical protein
VDTSEIEKVSAEVWRLVNEDDQIGAADKLLVALRDTSDVVLLWDLADVLLLLDHDALARSVFAASLQTGQAAVGPLANRTRIMVRLGLYRQTVELVIKQPAVNGVEAVAQAVALRKMGLPVMAYDANLRAGRSGRHRRWNWWRLWWRSGGPLRSVRSRQRDVEIQICSAWPEDPPPALWSDLLSLLHAIEETLKEDRVVLPTIQRSSALIDQGDLLEAADVVAKAVAEVPRSGDLRRYLANIEWQLGHNKKADELLKSADTVEAGSLQTVRDRMALCADAEWFRAGLALYAELPAMARRDPFVRADLGDLYAAMGLPALAHDAYPHPGWFGRRRRRRQWGRSGGPLWFARRLEHRFEERVQQRWRRWAENLRVLNEMPWPSDFDPAEIRNATDGYIQHWAMLVGRWLLPIQRSAIVVLSVLSWPVLFATTRHVAAITASAGVATAGCLAMVAAVWPLTVLASARTRLGRIARGMPLCVVLAGLGAAALRLRWPVPGWSDVVAAVPIMAASIMVGAFAVDWTVDLWFGARIRQFRWNHPRERVLDRLLDIAQGVADPSLRNQLDERGSWLSWLDECAAVLDAGLPARSKSERPDNWIANRARANAEALRRLRRDVAAPSSQGWDRIAATLRQDIVALATGELGDLAQTTPPRQTKPARTRRQKIVTLLRSIAVALLPLAAVIAAQPFLHLDDQQLHWAYLIGLAWAVVSVLTTDPLLGQKFDFFRSIVDFFRHPVSSERARYSADDEQDRASKRLTGRT